MTSQTSLPSQSGPIEFIDDPPLVGRPRRERVQDADAEVEAVEDGVAGQQHAQQDEPDHV